jgi:DNA-binding NarL/FixJ family response regulator
MAAQQITVLIAHPDPIVALGLAAALAQESDMRVVRPDQPSWDAAATLRRLAPDVAITGYEEGQVLASLPVRVLVVTANDREMDVRSALRRGVRGYLLSGGHAAEMVEAVRMVARGSHYICPEIAPRIASSLGHTELTGREADVLQLLAEGLANKQIAARLDIAVETVKCHVRAILDKLDAATRTEAAAVARRRGLVREVPARRSSPLGGMRTLQFNP